MMHVVERHACPCCGYKTITDTYDICGVCGWEHDPVQQDHPDDDGGANKTSLRDAQRNYRRFGACDEASKRHGRAPYEWEHRDSSWRPLDGD